AVELTFNEHIEPYGAELAVTDGGGTEVTEGEPQIEGPILTQTLTEQRAGGEYTVQWRVVSADGHPVSGEFTFQAAQAGGAGGTADNDTADGDGADEATNGDAAADAA